MIDLLWILALVVAPLGIGTILLYDRGVKVVLKAMSIAAEAEGLDPVKFRAWLDAERLRTPRFSRVMWTMLPGLLSLVATPEQLAKHADSGMFNKYRALHGENVESGEHPLEVGPPMACYLARAEMLEESADMLDILADEGCIESSLRREAKLNRDFAAELKARAVAEASK